MLNTTNNDNNNIASSGSRFNNNRFFLIVSLGIFLVVPVVVLISAKDFDRSLSSFSKKSNITSWEYDRDCVRTKYNDCTPTTHLRYPHTIRSDPCELLRQNNVNSIIFVGDSFVRHIYVATVLWLSGNYENGALKKNYKHGNICHSEGQFEEKKCRFELGIDKRVCDSTVRLKLSYGPWPKVTPEVLQKNDFVVWGGGNHPTDSNYKTKHGVNNATIVSEEKIQPLCNEIAHMMSRNIRNKKRNMKKNLIWANTHVQYHSIWPTNETWPFQSYEFLERYHEAIPNEFRKYCTGLNNSILGGGNGTTIDIYKGSVSVWNATRDLVLNHKDESAKMTYDKMHWGMNINLMKAHELFRVMFE